MTHFTYKETYVLSLVGNLKKETDINRISHALLGLYVCDFLDQVEASESSGAYQEENYLKALDNYFQKPTEVWANETLLHSIFKRLEALEVLYHKQRRIFGHFDLISFMGVKYKITLHKDIDEFILEALKIHKPIKNEETILKIIRMFNKRLFSLLQSYDDQQSTFEIRFFWSESVNPDVYECSETLFYEKDYKKEKNEDRYVIIKDDESILKVRKGNLKIKTFIHDFYNIDHFIKKKPATYSIVDNNFDRSQFIDVCKERYINKLGFHSKIEFSIIKVNKKTWKTICIESKKLEIVLALSFLINQNNSERLTYSEFLNKFYLAKT